MDDLDLSLPPQQPAGKGPLLPLVVALLIVVLVQLGWTLTRDGQPVATGDEALKSAALQLEENQLAEAAAEAWGEYLRGAGLPAAEEAAIRYRLAELLREKAHYRKALAEYYRCEALADLPDLKDGINQGITASLEGLGQYTALRSELDRRVGSGALEGEVVVAEIGSRQVTMEDVDRQLEMAIKMELDQLKGMLPAAEIARQQEIMWQRATTPQMRLEALKTMLMEEALYLKARRAGRTEDPELNARLHILQKQYWAGEELSRYLADRVSLTENDLKAYYENHRQELKHPDTGELLSWDQARGEVFARLSMLRRQEAQQILFMDLKDEFDLVIHQDRLQPKAKPAP